MVLTIEKIVEVLSKWDTVSPEEQLHFYYQLSEEHDDYDAKYQAIDNKLSLYYKYKKLEKTRDQKERRHELLLARIDTIEEKEEILRIDTKVKNERAELEKGKEYLAKNDLASLDMASDAVTAFKQYLSTVIELIRDNLQLTPYSERDDDESEQTSSNEEKKQVTMDNEEVASLFEKEDESEEDIPQDFEPGRSYMFDNRHFI